MQLVVGRAATVAEGMIYVGGHFPRIQGVTVVPSEESISVFRGILTVHPYLKDIISKIWLKQYKYREYWEMRFGQYL